MRKRGLIKRDRAVEVASANTKEDKAFILILYFKIEQHIGYKAITKHDKLYYVDLDYLVDAIMSCIAHTH